MTLKEIPEEELPEDTRSYVNLLDKNIELITCLKNKILDSLDEENEASGITDLIGLSSMILIETIKILIDNTKAIRFLVKEGLIFQAAMIARNSVEILLRIIVQVDYYKSVNYAPAERDDLDIEDMPALIIYLRNKAKNNNEKFKSLAHESSKIVQEIVKEIFPNKKRILFCRFANELEGWYGELCKFAHPEAKLSKRGEMVFSAYSVEFMNSLNSSKLSYPGRVAFMRWPIRITFMMRIFICNALAVRLIIELFKNIFKDENYNKNILNVDEAYDNCLKFCEGDLLLKIELKNLLKKKQQRQQSEDYNISYNTTRCWM